MQKFKKVNRKIENYWEKNTWILGWGTGNVGTIQKIKCKQKNATGYAEK